MFLYKRMITSSIHFALIDNMTTSLLGGGEEGVVSCYLFYIRMVDTKWEIIFIIGAGNFLG